MVWLAALFPLSLLMLRRTRGSRLVSCVALWCLIVASGCGAGRAIPLESGSNPNPPPGPVTPAGTYTIVASASSGGLTRTVNLTLIVSRFSGQRDVSLQTAWPALKPEAHAHWKLYPPSHPVTSTTSPMKYRPGTLRLCIVLASNSAVSTPPAVTSALA